MAWAMRTAMIGEDAMAILARAQLYEEYVLGPIRGTACGRLRVVRDLRVRDPENPDVVHVVKLTT